MDKTRTISFLVKSPPAKKGILHLLGLIRQKIKEVKAREPELENYLLKDLGISRLEGQLRVTLYFVETKDQQQIREV